MILATNQPPDHLSCLNAAHHPVLLSQTNHPPQRHDMDDVARNLAPGEQLNSHTQQMQVTVGVPKRTRMVTRHPERTCFHVGPHGDENPTPFCTATLKTYCLRNAVDRLCQHVFNL